MLDYQHNINISFLRGNNSVWTHAHVLFAVYWLNVSTYFLLINCNQNHFKNQAWNNITSETRTESEPVIKSKPFLVKKKKRLSVCLPGSSLGGLYQWSPSQWLFYINWGFLYWEDWLKASAWWCMMISNINTVFLPTLLIAFNVWGRWVLWGETACTVCECTNGTTV